MSKTITDAVISVYQAFKDMPKGARPITIYYPKDENPDISKKPYIRIFFLGTGSQTTLPTGKTQINLLFQAQIAVSSATKINELNGYIQGVYDHFPANGIIKDANNPKQSYKQALRILGLPVQAPVQTETGGVLANLTITTTLLI